MEWFSALSELLGVTPSVFTVLLLAAFIAGFIDAIAGGGGLLTVPALLASGLPPHVVLGTNKLAATFGSFTASLTFYKKRLFSPSFWKLSIWATAFGAIIGTLAVHFLSAQALEKLLPIFIGFSALYALFNRIKDESEQQLPTQTNALKVKQVIQGVTLGFYDGFAGPGTGAFWTVSSLALYRINLLLASGVARTMNFVSNGCSLITFIYLGHVNYLLGLSMGVVLMLGAYTGAHSAIHFGQRFIRPIFTLIVSFMAVKLAFDAWS